jgi:Uma2 family endonuclease
MLKKQQFYRQHGVLEMFFYDPESYEFWFSWTKSDN